MMYLTVLFFSPIYFALRRKWGAFLLNGALYGTAVLLLISLIGAFLAPFFWLLAVGHAGWHLRHELMHEHAKIMASAMVEELRKPDNRAS